MSKKMKMLDKKDLYDLYIEKSMSLREISEQLNVSVYNIKIYLKEYKIPKRTRSQSAILSNQSNKINLEPFKSEIIDLYVNEKKNCCEIGKIYGVRYPIIVSRLGEWGIDLKSGGIYINITKETLIDLYINKEMSIREISEQIKVSMPTIKKEIKRHSIKKTRSQSARQSHQPNRKNLEPFKGEIIDLYLNENKSSKFLGKEYDCDKSIIIKNLKKWGIEIQIGSILNLNEEEIIKQYKNGLSIETISKNFNCDYGSIERRLKNNNIKIRHITVDSIDKDELYNLYIIEKLGGADIAEKLNVEKHIVYRDLKKYDIPVRINSEAQKLSYENGNRKDNSGICKYYYVSGLRCQGSYERDYIENLIKNNEQLPTKPVNGVKTPFGFYFPDFEYSDRYIEIKSTYTYDICLGKKRNLNGLKSNNQHEKYKWTGENFKPVEILVYDNNVDLVENKLLK